MPRKSRRVASQQAKLRERRKRQAKKAATPLPQSEATVAREPAGRVPPQAATPAPSAPRQQAVIRPQAPARPAVYDFMGREMLRIAGIMAVLMIVLVVLGLVLR